MQADYTDNLSINHSTSMKKKRDIPNWENLYRTESVESMPWYHPLLDHDIDRALHCLKIVSCSVLDLGTGPGTQAIAMAERGFLVTATDISATAVRKAAAESEKVGIPVRFMHDDILRSSLHGTFDLIIDRGCFHVLHEEQRSDYVKTVFRLLGPGGYLLLKCFSNMEKREEGPYRFSPAEIKRVFSSRFTILCIEHSVFLGTLETSPLALFCIMKRPEHPVLDTA